ncbi:hypothetical protein FJY71_01255 [candidate division WOR-3 bacterium]|nr:hypothetical protein [candidate division WOR-3 bacterium]
MKPIREVYPDCGKEGAFDAPDDYTPLLESIGHQILVSVDEERYEGDSFLIVKDSAGKYGLLIFGWGSCSGCDALQGTRSYQEIEELRQNLIADIRWFSCVAALIAYVSDTSRTELQHYYHSGIWPKFVAAVQAMTERSVKE